jgi:hypothetical protein
MGHGEIVRDRDTAVFADGLFDVQLAGNHELWHAYGLEVGRFAGIDANVLPETREILRSWTKAGQLLAACEIDGWLVSHDGIHSSYAPGLDRDPTRAAAQINERLRRRLNAQQPSALFDAIGYDRGGATEHGGIFWEDFERLVGDESNPWRQIVGHTPQRDVRRVGDRLWCVDVGAALSRRVPAIVKRSHASDWEPVVAASSAGSVAPS